MARESYISIIVATFNAAQHLERCLRSVEAQCHVPWQLIVQDGGSTDATLSILQRHASALSLVSEADRGIYDAWNRAVQRLEGRWALFLGADDFLLHGQVLAQCAHFLQQLESSIQLAYGVLAMGRHGTVEGFVDRSRYDVFSLLPRDMGLPFPATFVRADLLRGEPFDPSFKIAGDYDFCAAHAGLHNLARLPVCVSYFEQSGISNDAACKKQLLQERLQVLRQRIRPRREALALAAQATRACHEQEHGFQQLPA